MEPTGSGDVLPVRMLLSILFRRIWVILLVAIVLAGLVVGNSLSQQPMYEASSTVLIGQSEGIVDVPADAQSLVLLVPTLVEAIASRPVAEEVVENLKLRDTSPDAVAANTSAEQIPETQFIIITYVDANPKRAQRVADAIASAFVKQFNEETAPSSSVSAEVWEQAIMPTAPSNRDPLRNGVLALMMGSLIGVGLAFLLEYLDDRVRSLAELARICGVPALGVIPKHKTPSRKKSSNR